MKVAFLGERAQIERVFARGRREAVEAMADVVSGVVTPDELGVRLSELRNVEVLFSTWGMPVLTREELDGMPGLRGLFYAAGAVDHFAGPLAERGIFVSSASHANAAPVAEFTLGQILLSCKGYFRNTREFAADPLRTYGSHRGPGAFGEVVALLGAGAVGTRLIELLRAFRLEVVVFDPFLTPERAASLRVKSVSIETAFEQGLVVSNHLIDNAATAGLIDGGLLAAMRFGATFINTGRGKTVRTEDLVRVMRERPDLTALLDVTEPEPLPPGSPLWQLPNVVISTHIAGSIGDEVQRLADSAIEEFERFLRGESLRYRVLAPAEPDISGR